MSIIVKQMVRSESFIVKTQAVLSFCQLRNCLGLLSCRNSRIALGSLVLPSLLLWKVFTAITTMVNYWFYTFICTMLNSIAMPLQSSNFLPKQKVDFFFFFVWVPKSKYIYDIEKQMTKIMKQWVIWRLNSLEAMSCSSSRLIAARGASHPISRSISATSDSHKPHDIGVLLPAAWGHRALVSRHVVDLGTMSSALGRWPPWRRGLTMSTGADSSLPLPCKERS